MEVRKLPGKRNRRLVRARVRVGASLQAVRATLTDYEGLAGFIPGLSECRLIHQDAAFARLYQVGEQDLALGFKFNAKGTIDCYEGEMEVLPESRSRRRQIAFDKVDVDLKVFEGKWSVQEVQARRHLDRGVGERRGRGWRFRSVIFLDAGGSVSIQPKRQTASGAACSGWSWRLRGGGQWGSATGRGQGR